MVTRTAARRIEGGDTTSAAMGSRCSMENCGAAAISVSLWPKNTCSVKNNIYYDENEITNHYVMEIRNVMKNYHHK